MIKFHSTCIWKEDGPFRKDISIIPSLQRENWINLRILHNFQQCPHRKEYVSFNVLTHSHIPFHHTKQSPLHILTLILSFSYLTLFLSLSSSPSLFTHTHSHTHIPVQLVFISDSADAIKYEMSP